MVWPYGRTMAFVTLSMIELVHSINVRTEGSIFKVGIFKNRYLIGAFIIGAVLQIAVISIPGIAEVFSAVPLTASQWLTVTLIAISPIFIMEIQKKINEIKFGRVVYNSK